MENRHSLADCQNCPLFNDTTEFIDYPDPAYKVDVSFVTGSPSASDVFKGGFFNTKAGELVKRIFKHYNQSPTVYSTSAVLCRSNNKKIPARAVMACRPRLTHQLQLAGAALGTVPFGPDATLAVLGQAKVGEARVGPPKHSEWINGNVVPTVNPYACFHNQSLFPSLVEDIGKLYREYEVFTEPDYEVLYTSESARDYLLSIICTTYAKTPDITIDIECDIDKEEGFGHPEHYGMLCIGIQVNDDLIRVLDAESLNDEVYSMLASLMKHFNITAQNGKFDLNGLRPHVGKQKLSFDTMLAHYCLDVRSGTHGLKSMAQEYLGAPPYDDEIKEYIGPDRKFSRIPKDLLHKYNAFDVHVTRKLKKLFEKELADHDLTKLHDFLVDASNMIMDIEYYGITIDTEYLNKLVGEFEMSILLKEHQLSTMAYEVNPKGYVKGDGINPASPLQVKKFFADLKITLSSTDEEHLLELLAYEKPFPVKDEIVRNFASTLLEYRKETKLYGTYIIGVRDRLYKGRINSSYLLHGTTTGRLSSRNPNLQNIPRKSPIKQMYIASREDNVLINADYSQAELRVLSYLAQDIYFRDIFNDPSRDVFDELVPELYDGATKANTKPDDFKEKRTHVKGFVYGLSYGRTEFGIAAGFGMAIELAKKLKTRFFHVIPKIIRWQNKIKAAVKNLEDLVTPYGRHHRTSLITEDNIRDVMNEALAFMPQSIASDLTIESAIAFTKWVDANFEDDGNKPRIFNLVHDAIMVECHESVAEYVKSNLTRIMVETAENRTEHYVKFAADATIGKNWGELS